MRKVNDHLIVLGRRVDRSAVSEPGGAQDQGTGRRRQGHPTDRIDDGVDNAVAAGPSNPRLVRGSGDLLGDGPRPDDR
jgi:hypothetical protein